MLQDFIYTYFNSVMDEGFFRQYPLVFYTKPSVYIAYIIDSSKEPVAISLSATLVDDTNTPIVYDYTHIYVGIKYYISEEDTEGVVIDNNHDSGVYIDRSLENSTITIYNNSGEDITVQRVEYKVEPSNYTLSYLNGVSHNDSVLINQNEHWVLVDTQDCVIPYDSSLKYNGVFLFTVSVDGQAVPISNNREGVYLDRVYDPVIEDYVLAVFNQGSDPIQINSLLYISESVEPSIKGGYYVTRSLETTSIIEGGAYISYLDSFYSITGSEYVSRLIEVFNPIEGSLYKTGILDSFYSITGSRYISKSLSVIEIIRGGYYVSCELEVIDDTITIGGNIENDVDNLWYITKPWFLMTIDQ